MINDLKDIHKTIIKSVEDMGFTHAQLCAEAGIHPKNLSNIKNPTINTVMKLMEARDRLKNKLNS